MRKRTSKRKRKAQHRAHAFECAFTDRALVESGVANVHKDGSRSVKQGLVLPSSPRKQRPVAQTGFQAPVGSDEGIPQVDQEPVASEEDDMMVLSLSLVSRTANPTDGF